MNLLLSCFVLRTTPNAFNFQSLSQDNSFTKFVCRLSAAFSITQNFSSDTVVSASSSKSTMSGSKPCYLLAIPPEIRQEIYKTVFGPMDKPVAIGNFESPHLRKRDGYEYHGQLLRVNKTIWAEATPVFWESVTVQVDHCGLTNCLQDLGNLSKLRQRQSQETSISREYGIDLSVFRSIQLSVYRVPDVCIKDQSGIILALFLIKDLKAAGLTNLKHIRLYLMINFGSHIFKDTIKPSRTSPDQFQHDVVQTLSKELQLPIYEEMKDSHLALLSSADISCWILKK